MRAWYIREQKHILGNSDYAEVDLFETTDKEHTASTRRKRELATSIAQQMIQVIEKNEGTKLNYEVVGTKLFLGDDEIMVNLAKYEKDEPVHIDVVRNWDGALATSIGKSDDLSYAAQIDIPARAYTEKVEKVPAMGGDGEVEQTTKVPVKFDISRCTLTLWSID